MLDPVCRENLNAGLDELPCPVVLPSEWKDYFQRRGPQTWQGDDLRRFVRIHFPTRALMDLKTTLPAFPRIKARHVVLMKDISRQGCSFLHVEQLFPGERVGLTLPTGTVSYTIVRCVRHNDRCYEMGAQLTEA